MYLDLVACITIVPVDTKLYLYGRIDRIRKIINRGYGWNRIAIVLAVICAFPGLTASASTAVDTASRTAACTHDLTVAITYATCGVGATGSLTRWICGVSAAASTAIWITAHTIRIRARISARTTIVYIIS